MIPLSLETNLDDAVNSLLTFKLLFLFVFVSFEKTYLFHDNLKKISHDFKCFGVKYYVTLIGILTVSKVFVVIVLMYNIFKIMRLFSMKIYSHGYNSGKTEVS